MKRTLKASTGLHDTSSTMYFDTIKLSTGRIVAVALVGRESFNKVFGSADELHESLSGYLQQLLLNNGCSHLVIDKSSLSLLDVSKLKAQGVCITRNTKSIGWRIEPMAASIMKKQRIVSHTLN